MTLQSKFKVPLQERLRLSSRRSYDDSNSNYWLNTICWLNDVHFKRIYMSACDIGVAIFSVLGVLCVILLFWETRKDDY